MQLQFEKATVLVREHGTDIVILHTNLKPAIYPYDSPTDVRFETAKGSGERYVLEEFGIVAEIIKV